MGDGVLHTVKWGLHTILERGKFDRFLHTVLESILKKSVFHTTKNSHQKQFCTQFLNKYDFCVQITY